MRRFDADCYQGQWPFHSCAFSKMEDVRRAHEASGFEGGAISSLQSVFYLDPLSSEEALHAELAPGYQQVFSLNPLLPAAKDMFMYAAHNFGVRGLRLTRGYHGYSWNDSRVREILELAGQMDMPVIVTLRLEDARMEYIARPTHEDITAFGAALDELPDVPMLLSNVYTEEIGQIKASIFRRENTYVDTSYFKSPTDALEIAINEIGSERLVFGSGFPLGTLMSAVTMVEHAKLSQQDADNIWWNNAARLFHLK